MRTRMASYALVILASFTRVERLKSQGIRRLLRGDFQVPTKLIRSATVADGDHA